MRALETGRLVIRVFRSEDFEGFAALLDEAFGENASGSRDSKRMLLDHFVAADAGLELLHQPPYGDRAIVLRDGGALIGSVGFVSCIAPFGLLPSFEPTPRQTPEVGLYWALRPEHWGLGYATEAASAMVAYAFESLRLRRIVATTEHDNARSIAVMRRLGMRIERNPRTEPAWFQTVGVLDNSG